MLLRGRSAKSTLSLMAMRITDVTEEEDLLGVDEELERIVFGLTHVDYVVRNLILWCTSLYSKSKTLRHISTRGQQEWRKARACSKLRGWRGGGERLGFLRLLLNAPHHDRRNDGNDTCLKKTTFSECVFHDIV